MVQHERKRLATPPRKIPFTTRLEILFGGLTNRIGWPIFGLGMVFFWVFSLESDLMNIRKFSSDLKTAKGKIYKVRETGSIVNGKEVEEYSYQFWTESGLHSGTSYSRDQHYNIKNEVVVEYVDEHPEFSRIQGLRTAEYGIAVGLLPLIVPFVGFIMVYLGFKGGNHTIRLLKNGEVGYGKLVKKTATGREINDQIVYQMFFEFQAEDGEKYLVETHTHEAYRLEDEDVEVLLYNKERPTEALMFDSMPGEPKVDTEGNIKATGVSVAFGALLVPILAIGGNLLYMISLIIQFI
ncbi:MAG: hypothetical protein CMO01_09460 [Thalassobius sp.]|nr:hypothetical protein [Thalassovita sp.]